MIVRIPSASNQSVTVRHQEIDGQWTESILSADERGDIKILVMNLGYFEFISAPPPFTKGKRPCASLVHAI